MPEGSLAPLEANRQWADGLTSLLALGEPPVALAFRDEAPAWAAAPSHKVPSACTFWREARAGLLFADAAAHRECPIGTLTMGFDLAKEDEPAAMQLIQTMCDLKYFSMAEVAALPRVPEKRRGILYGPLAGFPVTPEVVIVVVDQFGAMLVAEASESTDLANTAGQSAYGRPACSVIPRAMASGRTMLSLGCIGARTYVGLRPEEGVAVIPAGALGRFVERLGEIARANSELARFHAGRQAAFQI